MYQKNMKIATITIGALIIIVFLILTFFLDRTIRIIVETGAPRVTKTPVRLKSAKLSIFSGNGELSELVIGNPEGFYTPSAIAAKNVKLNIDTT